MMFGFIVAGELIVFIEYIITMPQYRNNNNNNNNKDTFWLITNQRGIFGSGFKTFCQGIINFHYILYTMNYIIYNMYNVYRSHILYFM